MHNYFHHKYVYIYIYIYSHIYIYSCMMYVHPLPLQQAIADLLCRSLDWRGSQFWKSPQWCSFRGLSSKMLLKHMESKWMKLMHLGFEDFNQVLCVKVLSSCLQCCCSAILQDCICKFCQERETDEHLESRQQITNFALFLYSHILECFVLLPQFGGTLQWNVMTSSIFNTGIFVYITRETE